MSSPASWGTLHTPAFYLSGQLLVTLSGTMTRERILAELFDVPSDVTYLNTAFMAPRLKSVSRAGHDTVNRLAEPWKLGWEVYFEDVETARTLAAGLLNAPAGTVAMVHSASYGIQLAAQALEVDGSSEIVLLQDQFPSNVYSWLELAKTTAASIRTVSFPDDGDWTPRLLHAIGDKTAVVAIPNCHWLDGSIVDLAKVSAKCRAVGSALVLDISQSMGVIPLDVNKIKPDFVVSVCYKWLLGPHGRPQVRARHGRGPLDALRRDAADHSQGPERTLRQAAAGETGRL